MPRRNDPWKENKMISDYHIHTKLCRHAAGELIDYVAAAGNADLREICVTDHFPAPDGNDPRNRMPIEEYPEYLRIYSTVSNNPSPRVLLGIEADYYEGQGDYLASWLKAQPFDYVIGSVHYVGSWGIDNPAEIATWKGADVDEAWRRYFALISKLADTRIFDMVGHIDLPKKFGYRPQDEVIREIVAPALDRIASAGMGIEINTSGLRRPVKEIYPSPLILGMARQRNIPICFGSDAHRPEEVAFAFDQAVELAVNAGYREYARFSKRRKLMTPLKRQD
jgi:histidinol-phosphatase (PHP family)